MNVSRTQKVIATVAYADVFTYPLTRDEIIYWAIGGVSRMPATGRSLETTEYNGTEYVHLPGRGKAVPQRVKKKVIAAHKWHRIYHIMNHFHFIPTLLLVGVTGGLAVDNAKEEDDIDVFFISRKHTVWVTRMIVTLVAEGLGIRRRPNDGSVADKICLNMFMSEDALELPENERDLFAAHEVLQMVPLWQREGVYRRFLSANRWVNYFLPRAFRERMSVADQVSSVSAGFLGPLVVVCRLLEPLAKYVQLWYMNSRRTNEIIRAGMIRFHPRDARLWVREKFESRLKLRHIPLDKFFYHR